MSISSTTRVAPTRERDEHRATPRSNGVIRRGLRRWQEAGTFAVFVLPSLAVFTAIVFVPIVWTLAIGFTDERATRPETSFIGFDNFVFLLTNPSFLQALGNTLLITAIVVIFTNALGLAIALMLHKSGWLYNLLRSVFFTPVILSAVIVSVIWRSILVDDGLLNTTLRSIGVTDPPGWLSDPAIAIYSLSSIMVWQMLGFAVVVYLAGLAGIPTELEEAASIDGAGPLARFRAITWPLLAPSLTITTVMLMISSFKVYDQVAVLTNGGPGSGSTATIAFEVIQTAFVEQRTGMASAMAGIMLIIVAAANLIVLRVLQRREVTH
ncbi:carbohydrate ABC transporter permease [Agromyces italicus]|uniref:carbohydrate ABC transporter permease n=1 Tax=Agromyces italicus TaxID=279572 RepID=UPI001B7FD79D|nr:sugar ABC transporter permease [Agromyces italicus]